MEVKHNNDILFTYIYSIHVNAMFTEHCKVRYDAGRYLGCGTILSILHSFGVYNCKHGKFKRVLIGMVGERERESERARKTMK